MHLRFYHQEEVERVNTRKQGEQKHKNALYKCLPVVLLGCIAKTPTSMSLFTV